MKLFQRFALPTSFLSKPPAEWESLEEYKRCEDFFNKLSVVNDVAERGVALSQEYLPNVKSEAKKQSLLQTVKKYRTQFSKKDKTTLSQKY